MAETWMQKTAGAQSPAVSVTGPDWRERKDRPIYDVELWPHQSMNRHGLVTVLTITAVGLCLPLLALFGTPVFWGLLPFEILAFGGLCFAIKRNGKDLQISEKLSIWRDEVRVERREPSGAVRRWQAEPMKVRVRVYQDAKIEDYLTLSGGGREIELGAFLAPEERVALADELELALTKAVRG